MDDARTPCILCQWRKEEVNDDGLCPVCDGHTARMLELSEAALTPVQMANVLAQLNPLEVDILECRLGGATYRAIAADWHITPGRVRGRFERAHKRFQELVWLQREQNAARIQQEEADR